MAKNKTTKEDKYWGEKALMAIQGGFENPDETDKWLAHLPKECRKAPAFRHGDIRHIIYINLHLHYTAMSCIILT